jgi:membrane-bound lytic murein transglycosylase MltF
VKPSNLRRRLDRDAAATARKPRPRREVRRAGRTILPAVLAALALLAGPEARAEQDDLLELSELVAQRWTGDLDSMLERHLIRVLVVENRTHYFVDGATLRGLTYDAFERFEDDLNRELGRRALRVNVAYLPVHRGELLAGLREGRGDLAAANLTVTPARLAEVDFGRPWTRDAREIVVTGPASPPLDDLHDLSGQRVFVRPSSSYAESLAALNDRLARAGRPPVEVDPAPEVFEDEDLLEMLNAGLVPLVVVDDHVARFWAKIFDRIVLREDLVLRDQVSIAWAFRKGSPKLRAEVDAFVERYPVGSAFTNIKLQQYLRDTRYARGSLDEAGRRRFREAAALFQKYAPAYGFDWLLVTAQGYRESRLDQNARSRAGAIGIMQLLPATGAEMAVGDIREPEPNVHAGVKYLRRMLDRNFADASLEGEDRALFAFASYNAGPARVARLRTEAAAAGLDPNRWFDHVEHVAARRIGQETVRYVREIYKYYVAYKLAAQSRELREGARQEKFGGNGP